MPTLLDEHIARDRYGIAIVDDGAALTWGLLGERVNRWIDLLTRSGLGVGDRLAAVVGNRREAFELLLACLHSGITLVPVNWHLTETEIAHILADSGSRGVVTAAAYAPTVSDSMSGSAGDECSLRLVLGHRDRDGFSAVEPLLAAADPAESAHQSCGSTMLYTSGTTGEPKGVINNLFVTGEPFTKVERLTRYARAVLDVPAGERVMLDGPWYHSAQLFFALLSLLQGSRLVIRPRFDPAATLRTIDREQITAVHLVPTQFIRLLRLDEETRSGFSGASLRRVWHGAGPCLIEVKRQMIGWWGPVLQEYYGATEGGAVTIIGSADWLRHPGSVGRAVPAYELLILDDDDAPLPPDHRGRVFIRRKTGTGFRYHNAPEKTRQAHLAPDTFTYGEIGHLDRDGFLYITGREQDMIVSGGVNVYPAEVEAALLTHPGVRDAAVLGVSDPEFGERVVAVIEREPGAPGELGTLLDRHCRRRLAGFKAPRTYHFVDTLPREPTGKIRKDALRRAYTGRTPDAPADDRSPAPS